MYSVSTPSLTHIVCRTRRFQVNQKPIMQVVRVIREHLGVSGYEINIQFVGSTAIRRLNQTYRGKDKPTDVLSFPQNLWVNPLKVHKLTAKNPSSKPVKQADGFVAPDTQFVAPSLGDIAISLSEANTNAHKIGNTLSREVCFLLVHGILHLCGHDHEQPDEEKAMLRAQNQLMSILGNSNSRRPMWSRCVKLLSTTGSISPKTENLKFKKTKQNISWNH